MLNLNMVSFINMFNLERKSNWSLLTDCTVIRCLTVLNSKKPALYIKKKDCVTYLP